MKQSILALCSAAFFTFSSTAISATVCDDLPVTTDSVAVGKKNVLLQGVSVNVGDVAPDFDVVDESFNRVSLSDFKGKTVMLSIVPSLDTGVCSLQTKRFNDEVSKLPPEVVMLTISTDLPFAQKRFCKVENVDKLKVVSDAVWRHFGANYGMLIKDMGLLARGIFVINKDGVVTYKELVAQLSDHPDYKQALDAVKKAI